MAAIVDPDLCVGCGACADACPVAAIEVREGIAGVDVEECTDCRACEEECPNSAIVVP